METETSNRLRIENVEVLGQIGKGVKIIGDYLEFYTIEYKDRYGDFYYFNLHKDFIGERTLKIWCTNQKFRNYKESSIRKEIGIDEIRKPEIFASLLRVWADGLDK
jgi:hypothetical protein